MKRIFKLVTYRKGADDKERKSKTQVFAVVASWFNARDMVSRHLGVEPAQVTLQECPVDQECSKKAVLLVDEMTKKANKNPKVPAPEERYTALRKTPRSAKRR